jgi:thiosulfate dehydrogenase [quinone] large subunit
MRAIDRLFARRELADPRAFRSVFSNTGLAPLWLIARLYLGYQWLMSGWERCTGSERWIATPGPDGLGLKALWERGITAPNGGGPPVAYDWYRDVVQFMLRHEWYTWFSWIIAVGEVAAGVALIIGAFTGVAALGGLFLTFNFQLTGAATVNPLLFAIALLVMVGWKVAGWIGVDRWLLPALGMPWQPSQMWRRIGARTGLFGQEPFTRTN